MRVESRIKKHFSNKKNIDRVYKFLEKNDIDTSRDVEQLGLIH